jgi:hypothetical protein
MKSLFCKAVEGNMKGVLCPVKFKRLYYGVHLYWPLFDAV